MKRMLTVILIVLFGSVGLAYGQSAKDALQVIKNICVLSSLSDFERSPFCLKYACVREKGWPLKNGNFNNDYKVNINPPVSLEVPTKDDKITSIGIMFYDRPKLMQPDLIIIDDLIDSLFKGANSKKIKRFVRENIEKSVFQILMAKKTNFGASTIWAGKVGGQQIVHIKIK